MLPEQVLLLLVAKPMFSGTTLLFTQSSLPTTMFTPIPSTFQPLLDKTHFNSKALVSLTHTAWALTTSDSSELDKPKALLSTEALKPLAKMVDGTFKTIFLDGLASELKSDGEKSITLNGNPKLSSLTEPSTSKLLNTSLLTLISDKLPTDQLKLTHSTEKLWNTPLNSTMPPDTMVHQVLQPLKPTFSGTISLSPALFHLISKFITSLKKFNSKPETTFWSSTALD